MKKWKIFHWFFTKQKLPSTTLIVKDLFDQLIDHISEALKNLIHNEEGTYEMMINEGVSQKTDSLSIKRKLIKNGKEFRKEEKSNEMNIKAREMMYPLTQIDDVTFMKRKELEAYQRIGIEVQVNEFSHRYFYRDLHLEVINMVKIIIGVLNYFSNNSKTKDECIHYLKNGVNLFIDRLNTIVYIEKNMVLTSDEIIFGRILPYLWTEFNDKRRILNLNNELKKDKKIKNRNNKGKRNKKESSVSSSLSSNSSFTYLSSSQPASSSSSSSPSSSSSSSSSSSLSSSSSSPSSSSSSSLPQLSSSTSLSSTSSKDSLSSSSKLDSSTSKSSSSISLSVDSPDSIGKINSNKNITNKKSSTIKSQFDEIKNKDLQQISEIIFSMAYKIIHTLLMSISSIFTLTSLDFLTLIQPEWDIERTIEEYLDKIDNLLKKGLIYAIALTIRDKLGINEDNTYIGENNDLTTKYFLDTTIENDFDAIIALGNIIKLIYSSFVNIQIDHLEETNKTKELLENESNYSINYKLPTKEDVLLSGIYLFDLFVFGKLPVHEPNKLVEYRDVKLKLQESLYVSNKKKDTEKPSYSNYQINIESLIEAHKKLRLKDKLTKYKHHCSLPSQLHAFSTINFIPQIISMKKELPKKGKHEMSTKYTKWENEYHKMANKNIKILIIDGDKHFWPEDEYIKQSVAEQFAVGIVLKDNNLRHREWRPTFLIDSLAKRRFVDAQINNYFEKHRPSNIDYDLIKTSLLLGIRLYWKYSIYCEHYLLALLFPIAWFDDEYDNYINTRDKQYRRSKIYPKTTLKFKTKTKTENSF